MRGRYREAARRLVAATRRQEESAHRQETVLPPIEATAQLLALETEEVGGLLFSAPSASAMAPSQLPGYPSSTDAIWQGGAGGPPSQVQGMQQLIPASEPFGELAPPMDALRRARVLANDWGLRQQRVLADLATALNATDQLSRASLEGEEEAAALAALAVELLQTTR
jgi:hypothetical protein